jgi:anti-sigma factor ChrR (cupin superfamily)
MIGFVQLIRGGWRDLDFVAFREGVDICILHQGDADATTVAVLRYRPGASVPRHRHGGLETIIVLDGAQSDENGTYEAGDIVLNEAGSEHRVWSQAGCAVLIIWERPVEIL